jgi:hypothetical protein
MEGVGGGQFFFTAGPLVQMTVLASLSEWQGALHFFFLILRFCAHLSLMSSGGHQVGKVQIILVHIMKAYVEWRHS